MYHHKDDLLITIDETGSPHYFSRVKNKWIEINAEQYRCMQRTYRRQRYLNELAVKLRFISYDALLDALMNPDRNARIPKELCIESAEDAFFRQEEERKRSVFLGYYLYYASQLPYPTDRIVLESIVLGRTENELSRIYHLPASTIHDKKEAGKAKALVLAKSILGTDL